MASKYFHEILQRGTSDFPISYYFVNQNHPRYHMQTHWHKDIEVILVLSGTLKVHVGDNSFVLNKGNGMYIPSGITHGAEPENCVYECSVFSPTLLYSTPKISSYIKSKILSPVFFKENKYIEFFFKSLSEKNDGYEFEVISHLNNIALLSYKNQDNHLYFKKYNSERIKPSLVFIEENYSNEITLSKLAEQSSLSPNYFCKIFKESTGQTPIEYILTYRIDKSCEMLLIGKSVTETALDCGFNDLSYFIHIFKKHKGISPKKYSQNISLNNIT